MATALQGFVYLRPLGGTVACMYSGSLKNIAVSKFGG